jgi:hypothetical protein
MKPRNNKSENRMREAVLQCCSVAAVAADGLSP